MKIKSLLIGMLASIALVGCTNNEELPLAEESTTVQFAVNMEGALESRAISDGTGATTLMYGVFEKTSDTEMKQVIKKTVIEDVKGLIGNGYRMNISLLRGKTYQVVFWAQNPDCDDYSVSDDMKVAIDYTGINNDELRDAFFATQQVTVTSNSTINVTLKRPFAQINVGAFKTDYEYAQSLGVTVKKSSATIKKVPNQINLLTGVALGEVDVKYTFGDIPTESLNGVDFDENEALEIYKWVSMSYILASPDVTYHEMSFAFTEKVDENNETADQILFDAGRIPARRNYRSNIVGQVLSSKCNFNINIDPIYEGEANNGGHVYYIFNEPTTIENTEFALNKAAEGNWCVFTCPKDVNHLITFNNVTFSGKLYSVAFGEYYGSTYNNYSFALNNVKAEGVTVGNCVSNWLYDKTNPNFTIDHMSLLFYLRGQTTVKNCVWKGTKTVNSLPIDAEKFGGVKGEAYDVNIAYDCGIPNFSTSIIEDSEIGSMYVWTQAKKVHLLNTKVDYLRTGLITAKGNLILDGEETVVTNLEISDVAMNVSYKPSLVIQNGAKVTNLYLNGYNREKFVNLGIDLTAIENIYDGSCPLN